MYTETRRTYRAVFSEPEVVYSVPLPAGTATDSTDSTPVPSSTEPTTAPAQPSGAGTPSEVPAAGNGKKRLREELEEAEASVVGEGQKSVVSPGDVEKKRESSQGPSAKKKKKKTKGKEQGK